MRRLTADEINEKLPPYLTIKPDSYILTDQPAVFIDAEFGEFTALVKRVLKGSKNHPKRGSKQRREKRIPPVGDLLLKLKGIAPELTLEEGTYVSCSKKAKFIDDVFGEWWTRPTSVLRGHRHPRRSKKQIKPISELLKVLQQLREKGLSVEIEEASYTGMRSHANFKIDGVSQRLTPAWVLWTYREFRPSRNIAKYSNKKISLQELIAKLPVGISIVSETFVDMGTKALFKHEEHGDWWTTPSSVVTMKYKHPKIARKNNRGRTLTLVEIKSRLPVHVKIVEDSYGPSSKAKFVDEVFGIWEADVNSVLQGHGHRERGMLSVRLSIEEVEARLPPHLKLVRDTYVDVSTPATLIDEKYGRWVVIPQSIFQGHDHPHRTLNSGKPTKLEFVAEGIFGLKKYDKCPSYKLPVQYRPDFKISDSLFVNVDGMYHHSDSCKSDNYYHFDLREGFEREGLRIVQFRAEEVYKKSAIIKAMVDVISERSLRIPAQQLTAGEVSPNAAKKFLIENHLKGFVSGSYLGLFEGSDLKMVLAYRRRQNSVVKIVRICPRIGFSIENGLLTLIKALLSKETDAKKVTAWVDLRHSTGKSLLAVGFEPICTRLGWRWTDYLRTFNQRTLKPEVAKAKIYDAGQRLFTINDLSHFTT